MRRLIVFALVAWIAYPALAARRVTVAQLAEALAAGAAEHRGDQEIARQVSGMDLSERLTTATLNRLAAKLPCSPAPPWPCNCSPTSRRFSIRPPTNFRPPPRLTRQPSSRCWLRRAPMRSKPGARLPNFFVSRVTTRFDDGAQVLHKGDWPVRAGLHPVGQSAGRSRFATARRFPTRPHQLQIVQLMGQPKWACEAGASSARR